MKAPLIAIIDDDEAMLKGLSSLLRSANYRVCLYSSAEAFLENCEAACPDCVLTDVQMPRMNGLQLQLKLNALHPELPIIIMTAFAHPTIEERVLEAGAKAILYKPFDAEIILGALHDALHAP